jgi:hypothetical protein
LSKMTRTTARLSVAICRGMDLLSAALPMVPRFSARSISLPMLMSSSSTGGFRIFRASTCYLNCVSAA